jgi:DUF1009 family protein
MGTRIGIIAGSGGFPLEALEGAKRLGYACVVAGLRGEAVADLEIKAPVFEWFEIGEIQKLVSFFQKQDVREVVMIGKVDPRATYKRPALDDSAGMLLTKVRDKTPTSLLKAFIEFLEGQGLSVKNPSFLIQSHFCPEGVLTDAPPAPDVLGDIDFGWKIAKTIADLDLGQTVVIKDKAVVAVEGMEGTDETIKRGGRLAGKGIVVVKVGRSVQDMRIDLPAAGIETLRNLVRVKAAAFCIEADKVPLFQKDEVIALAKANGVAIIVKK